MSGLFPLYGLAQNYAWGGMTFIPALLNLDNSAQEPYAEWWLGAHEEAPSVIMTPQGPQPLHYSIAHHAQAYLGDAVCRMHGKRLPFLLKVLDVAAPLSIQAHPDATQARQGFERENAAGVALNDSSRNYKDPFPKPEMMVALSPFWLLHGFRSESAIAAQLARHPEWGGLRSLLTTEGVAPLYRHLMTCPQSEVSALLKPVIQRLGQLERQDHDLPDYWFSAIASQRGEDRGLFGCYLLNLVALKPGQAIFQSARLPHAYLYGQNIEIMANSDNVLRGGLTDKHIDVNELLSLLDYTAVTPEILTPTLAAPGLQTFPRHGRDYFALDQLFLSGQECVSLISTGPEIIFVLEGVLLLEHAGRTVEVGSGQSVYLQPGSRYTCRTGQNARAYRAHCAADG